VAVFVSGEYLFFASGLHMGCKKFKTEALAKRHEEAGMNGASE
jgi:hypothetical protein